MKAMKWLTGSRTGRVIVPLVASVLILFAIWRYTESNESYTIPTLGDILVSFKDNWLFDRVGSDVIPSLRRMAIGFAIAIVGGVLLGFALGSSKILDAVSAPMVNFLRSVPAAALLPPAIVIFGIGDTTKIAVIAFVCCWPIILNTRDGVRELDATMLSSATVYGITGMNRFVAVILPAVAPRIFAGMRISLSIAILLLVTSEMVASTNGIGYVVFQSQQMFAVDDMWAGVILLGLLGIVLNFLLGLLERFALRRHRPEQL